jgi:hypothetical protein
MVCEGCVGEGQEGIWTEGILKLPGAHIESKHKYDRPGYGQQQGYGIILFVICRRANTSSTSINHPPATSMFVSTGKVMCGRQSMASRRSSRAGRTCMIGPHPP